MRFHKEMLLLYAITDQADAGRQVLNAPGESGDPLSAVQGEESPADLIAQVEEALQGGVTMLQLREKHLTTEELIRKAVPIRDLCHRYGVPLIINDNVEAALKSGADGVHVGMEDMPVKEIRRIVPEDFIIGATCKTVEQAKAAQAAGADYMGVGAVFPSSTKKKAVRITTKQLRDICSAVTLPAVAIGGITRENAAALKGSGIAGIAVVSAIFSQEDIRKAAGELKLQAQALVS